MKGLWLLCVWLLFCIRVAHAQVSFAQLDTLYYTTAVWHSTYEVMGAFPLDFNNDGFDDVIHLNGRSIYLSLNTGANSFQDETLLYTDEDHIVNLSNFADINGDSKPDVAIATLEGIKILYAGNDEYVPARARPDPVTFGKIMLTDHDNDGKLDLISSFANSLFLYNDIGTSLDDKSVFYTDEDDIYGFGIDDINGDDDPDLMIITYLKKFRVYLGNPDGTRTERFSKAISALVSFQIADVSLDGYKDITYMLPGSDVFLLTYNSTTETFTEQPIFAGSPPENMYGFFLLDLRNNGTTDLIYNAFASMVVRETNGLGQHQAPTTLFANEMLPHRFKPFSLDNDGYPDMLFGDFNKFQAVSFHADGTVKNTVTKGYHADFKAVRYHDMDDDGFEDIVQVSETGALYVRWGNADRDFTSYSRYELPINVGDVTVQDVTGDGNADLLMTRAFITGTKSTVLIVEGKGNREFEPARDWKFHSAPGEPIIADVNKDGRPDVVVFERFGNSITWFDTENTEYFFSDGQYTMQGDGIMGVSADDMNDDDYVDLITANRTSKDVSVLINDQDGGFVETRLPLEGTVVDVLAVKAFDYNLDELPDLLVIVETAHMVYDLQVFLNDQEGHFSFSTMHPLRDIYYPTEFDVLDLDGDEDLDLVVSAWDYTNTNVFLREEAGMTNIGGDVFENCGQGARIYEDLNADGLVDVFTATYVTGATYMQLNNAVRNPEVLDTRITIEQTYPNAARISFSGTRADGRLVIVTKGEHLAAKPVDNYFYASNPAFGIGSKLETNSYVVHAGSATSFDVTGLSAATTYLVSVFEYDVNDGETTIINYSEGKTEKTFTTHAAPQIAAIADITGSNLDPVSIDLEISDLDDAVSDLRFDVTSSNPAVVPMASMGVAVTGALAALQFTPADYGETEITVTVTDADDYSAMAKFKYTSLVVGIGEFTSRAFSVYPNPFTTLVEIRHSETRQRLTVYNSSGMLVQQFEGIPAAVDLSGLPPGLYFFTTSDGKWYRAVKR